jgi:DNA-binding beta-propeller fold protein YncE
VCIDLQSWFRQTSWLARGVLMKFVVRHRPLAAGILLCGALALSSCGNAYRVIIGPINPVQPTPLPEYYPVVLSVPTVGSDTNQGYATILTSAGDAAIVQVNVGVNPVYLALTTSGSPAFAVNLGQSSGSSSATTGSISSFNVISTLISAQVETTTLPTSSFPSSEALIPDFANSSYVYVPTLVPGTSTYQVAALARSNAACGGVPCVVQTLPVQGLVANFTGLTTGTRTYAIEPTKNQVETIDITTNGPTITGSPLPTGSTPVFGVMSPDGYRTFILNKGDGTITAINSQSNQVMTPPGPIPVCGTVSPCPGGAPVSADYYNTGSVLVTANSGNNTMSAINVAENDSNFGTVLYTTPVGTNPVSVAVLQDGSYAYVANQGDPSDTTTPGSISLVNLASGNVDETIPLTFTDPATNTSYECIQPVQVLATPGTSYQKVFVRCLYNSQTTTGGAVTNASFIWAIRTFYEASASGNTAANVVEAVIPIIGNTTYLAMEPTR